MNAILLHAFLIFTFISAVSFFVWRNFREETGFLYWSIGMLVEGCSWGLLMISEGTGLTLHNLSGALGFAGHFIILLALVTFSYGKISVRMLGTAALLITLFFITNITSSILGYTTWDELIPLLHIILDTLMAYCIFRERRPENTGVVYTVTLIYAVFVVISFQNIIMTISSSEIYLEIFAEDTINTFAVLGATFLKIVGTIALTLLAFTKTAQHMKDLAGHDPLTHTLNRRAWDIIIEREIKRAKRYKTPMSIILFDLDHFKVVNDRYGHLGGDETLKVISSTVSNELRDIDYLCRYGGEEFVTLLTDIDLNQARITAERLRARIENTSISYDKQQFSITASLGIAEYHPETDTADSLVARADQALYEAKRSGRNKVEISPHDIAVPENAITTQ